MLTLACPNFMIFWAFLDRGADCSIMWTLLKVQLAHIRPWLLGLYPYHSTTYCNLPAAEHLSSDPVCPFKERELKKNFQYYLQGIRLTGYLVCKLIGNSQSKFKVTLKLIINLKTDFYMLLFYIHIGKKWLIVFLFACGNLCVVRKT